MEMLIRIANAKIHYTVKHYKTPDCSPCHALAFCTKNKGGRLIESSEYQPYIEINKQNIEANPEIYKKRQSILEHPYGRSFYYEIIKKGRKRIATDVGFMFIDYNLRRIMNIMDKVVLKKFLESLLFHFL